MQNPEITQIKNQQLHQPKIEFACVGTQRKKRIVTRHNGRIDCRSVKFDAFVTWSTRARSVRFLKNFAI